MEHLRLILETVENIKQIKEGDYLKIVNALKEINNIIVRPKEEEEALTLPIRNDVYTINTLYNTTNVYNKLVANINSELSSSEIQLLCNLNDNFMENVKINNMCYKKKILEEYLIKKLIFMKSESILSTKKPLVATNYHIVMVKMTGIINNTYFIKSRFIKFNSAFNTVAKILYQIIKETNQPLTKNVVDIIINKLDLSSYKPHLTISGITASTKNKKRTYVFDGERVKYPVNIEFIYTETLNQTKYSASDKK
jgi:CHAT domain-containing protein